MAVSAWHLLQRPGPAPSASMMENPANAISVFRPMDGSLCSSVYFYLPLRVNTLHIYFIILVILLVGPHANSSVSRVTHVYSCSGPCGGQILVSVFFSYLPVFYDACARTYWYTVVADIPCPRTSLGGAVSPLPRPRSVVREGCVRHAFPRHTPSLKQKT